VLFASGLIVFLSLALAFPLHAQEARWNELIAQASNLHSQGKFAEAIPVAQEALELAEKAFGPDSPYTAVSLSWLGVVYEDQGAYAEAEPLFKRSLAIQEKALGPDHLIVASTLNTLANLYRDQGKYAEAEPLLKRSLAIFEQVLGPDHLDVATALNNLAVLYKEQGRYAEAEPLNKGALAIDEKALGPDHPDVARGLDNLAELYRAQGKYAEAEPLYRRALAIREKALGPDHADVALALNNLALLYDDEGRYAEAEPLYKRALAIDEKALGPDHADVALTLNNLAALYEHQGKYAEAEPLYERSLAIGEKTRGPDNPDVAGSLNNLAALYMDQGKYAEAEPLYRRALAIREKALGPDHPDVAISLSNLAALYQDQGRYAEAEPLYKRSLAIDEKALGPDHPHVAAALNYLAVLYKEQGRYAEAEPLFKRALAIREKALGPDHPDVALSLNNLAGLYMQQGRYAEAEPLYKRSLAIREKVLGPAHPHMAESLNNLALLYWDLGLYAEAEPLYKRALAIDEKALGPDHPGVATALGNLAALYEEQGRYAEAEPLFKRSLAIKEKALGPDHPGVATALGNLALLYEGQGNYAQAEAFFEPALQNLSRQFEKNFGYMSEKDRLQFLVSVQFNFEVYSGFCLAYRQRDPILASKMYDLLLWEKGLVGASVAALRAQVAASGDAEALRLFDQLAEKKSESVRLASARFPRWQELRKNADDEANDLEQQLARRVSSLAAHKSLAHASWRDVQKKLQPGEAAVEFVRFRFHDGKKWTDTYKYVALVVTPDEKEAPAFISLGDAADLEADPLRDYRLRVGLNESGTVRGVAVKEEAQKPSPPPKITFYDAFWKPLESALGNAKRIYLSPDGALNQVALGDVPADDGRLLMEKYDLRIVSSTKDILRDPRKLSANSAVLMGNPTFDLDEAQQRAALRSALSTQTAQAVPVTEATGLLSRDFTGGTLSPLPGTQAEVQAISPLLEKQHWNVQSFTQQNALKETLLHVKAPRLLHLATHGFFESDQPEKEQRLGNDQPSGLEDPMLRSGLFFAGANRRLSGQPTPTDLDDGVLTAYEASTLNLQGTELVVLSACETGLGEVAAGEGVFGLRRALEVAGAESVLMSMWSVPDQGTQELMSLFYAKWLAGQDKHEALREAQLEMRARVKKRYGRDLPQKWGAFVLVGR